MKNSRGRSELRLGVEAYLVLLRVSDLLIGGPGHDTCDGGPGRDRLHGCERIVSR